MNPRKTSEGTKKYARQYREAAKIHRLTCRRCQTAKRVGNWRCRDCGLLVCEHFCMFKKIDGVATCVRCVR